MNRRKTDSTRPAQSPVWTLLQIATAVASAWVIWLVLNWFNP